MKSAFVKINEDRPIKTKRCKQMYFYYTRKKEIFYL